MLRAALSVVLFLSLRNTSGINMSLFTHPVVMAASGVMLAVVAIGWWLRGEMILAAILALSSLMTFMSILRGEHKETAAE